MFERVFYIYVTMYCVAEISCTVIYCEVKKSVGACGKWRFNDASSA